jgi:hypothetical protein
MGMSQTDKQPVYRKGLDVLQNLFEDYLIESSNNTWKIYDPIQRYFRARASFDTIREMNPDIKKKIKDYNIVFDEISKERDSTVEQSIASFNEWLGEKIRWMISQSYVDPTKRELIDRIKRNRWFE